MQEKINNGLEVEKMKAEIEKLKEEKLYLNFMRVPWRNYNFYISLFNVFVPILVVLLTIGITYINNKLINENNSRVDNLVLVNNNYTKALLAKSKLEMQIKEQKVLIDSLLLNDIPKEEQKTAYELLYSNPDKFIEKYETRMPIEQKESLKNLINTSYKNNL